MANINFDYFTAAEAEQYTFYRIPKALFTEGHFQSLSCEAKVLYGMMLDRMGLSIRNQWFDSQGRAYIIFTVEDVMKVMGCQSQKAVRLMKELDTVDGIGLIEKKRIGLGRPNRIYVKNFMARGDGGTDSQAGNRSSAGKKAEDGPCNADANESNGASQACAADVSGCREAETAEKEVTERAADMPETAGCMANSAASETEKNNTDSEENWWMCGETVDGPESSMEKDDGVQEENWWDMAGDICLEDSVQQQGAENVPDGMGLWAVIPEGPTISGDFGGMVMETDVESVDNVDNHIENQNTARPAERKAGNGRQKGSVAFADKTVEAMVRELLWQEGTTTGAGSGSPEQEAQAGTRQEFPEPQDMECEKKDSATVDAEVPESWNAKRNDTEYSNTEYSEIENSKTENNETDFPAFYQSYQSYPSNQTGRQCRASGCGQDGCDPDAAGNSGADSMDVKMDAYREAIRENISYSCFTPRETEDVDELVELMVDAMMVPDRQTIRVAGTEKPASVVKSRFMKLVHSHIEYVMGCLQKHTGKIWNIKAYLLTALYNSSLTISSYYRAEVNHDLYGCGC